MPERQFITGIPGVQVLDVFEGKTICVRGKAVIQSETCCPRCQSQRFRIKSTKERTLKHGIFGQKLVRLVIKIPK